MSTSRSSGRPRKRRLLALGGTVVAAAALALAPATQASAHDYLVSSTPKSGSTVSAPLEEVTLTFNDRVLDLSGDGSSNVVEVTGPSGKHFEAGCPAIADTQVSVPVALGASGDYTVRWQIVSADGHTVSDSIDFAYDAPRAATAAAGADSRPTCGDQAASTGGGENTAASGSEADTAGSGGLGIALGVGGGVIVVALVAVAVVLTRARRGTGPTPPSAD